MSYRAPTCGFCAMASEAMCPRCEVRVCDAHRRSQGEWCAICDAEHREEIELAVMEATLARTAVAGARDEGAIAARGLEGGVVLLGVLYDFAVRPVRKRRARARAEAEFEARTPEEIARQRAIRGITSA